MPASRPTVAEGLDARAGRAGEDGAGLERQLEGVDGGLPLLHGDDVAQRVPTHAPDAHHHVVELTGRADADGVGEPVEQARVVVPLAPHSATSLVAALRARSPARTPAASPSVSASVAGEPRLSARATKTPDTLGSPRRRRSLSMTSSWITKAVCSSSTAAATRPRHVVVATAVGAVRRQQQRRADSLAGAGEACPSAPTAPGSRR